MSKYFYFGWSINNLSENQEIDSRNFAYQESQKHTLLALFGLTPFSNGLNWLITIITVYSKGKCVFFFSQFSVISVESTFHDNNGMESITVKVLSTPFPNQSLTISA